jgi:hypothetical protein
MSSKKDREMLSIKAADMDFIAHSDLRANRTNKGEDVLWK